MTTRTHEDKIFWPKEGYTKGDVLDYYQSVAATILPYLKNRPMVLNRHPNGIDGESFFQKNFADGPDWVKTAIVKHTNKNVRYVLVQDKKTLLYVANLGCIELNPFHSCIGSIDKPDYLIFDLDPERLPFDAVVDAALAVHAILEEFGMPNLCKTSGGRGLHIYVPLAHAYTYKQVQGMAKLVASLALASLPKLFSLERSPAKRQKRVYIDTPRNSGGQTIAAPYSLRPRPHAPVSTPLAWKEVKHGLDPTAFNIETLPNRLKKVGDLFKRVLGKGVDFEMAIAKYESLHRKNRANHQP
jgi:bifunctional non-homologous end joining protein LigD